MNHFIAIYHNSLLKSFLNKGKFNLKLALNMDTIDKWIMKFWIKKLRWIRFLTENIRNYKV